MKDIRSDIMALREYESGEVELHTYTKHAGYYLMILNKEELDKLCDILDRYREESK